MALVKRKGSRYWHYSFEYRGHTYRGSTDQTNKNVAKLVEAKVRSDVALEAFGIGAPKQAPFFKEFLEGKFLAHVRQHNADKPRTVGFYREKVTRLLKYKPFTSLRLSQIDEGVIDDYCRACHGSVAVATINGDISTLRKALILAHDWRLIARRPKIKNVPGAKGREFVLDGPLETLYLSLAEYPLKEAAILMLDLGLRPEECLSLLKTDVTDEAVIVWEGKTKNAGRALPQTDRTRRAIELLCALWPDSPFLFPGRKGKHYNRKSLDNLHSMLRERHDLPPEFVLYTCRHTFGTRLAESGASNFEIKTAMGHGSITVSQKYIHLSASHLTTAMKRKEAYDKIVRGEMEPAATKSTQIPD